MGDIELCVMNDWFHDICHNWVMNRFRGIITNGITRHHEEIIIQYSTFCV